MGTTVTDVLNTLSPQDRLLFKELEERFQENQKGVKYDDIGAVARDGLSHALDSARAKIIENESSNSACAIAARYLHDEEDILKQLQTVCNELRGHINNGTLSDAERKTIADRMLERVRSLLNASASDGTRFFGETVGSDALVKDLIANPNVDDAGNVNTSYANSVVSSYKLVELNQLDTVTIGRAKVTDQGFADLIASINLFKTGKNQNRLIDTSRDAQSFLESLSRRNLEDIKASDDAKQSNEDAKVSAEQAVKDLLDKDPKIAIQDALNSYRAMLTAARFEELAGKLYAKIIDTL